MPTRSGLDYKTINPSWFVCSYCYEATPNWLRQSGMQRKRVQLRLDDDEFVTLPDQWTRVWTEPHCPPCNRRIKGYPKEYTWRAFKYV